LKERHTGVVDVPFAKGAAVSSPSFSTLDIRLYIHLAEERLAANGRDEAKERRKDCEGGKGGKETGGKECEEREERFCEQLTAFRKQLPPTTRSKSPGATNSGFAF
jgi:hypothetical protein